MSIEKSNFSPESPEEKYIKLLTASVETSKKYKKLSEALNQEGDKSLSYEETEAGVSDLAHQMDSEMQERVALLRQSGIANIENVFPRTKRNPEAEGDARQLGELQELSGQETEQFGKALEKLAQDNGYEIEDDGLGSWVTLKKNGLEFQIKINVPSEKGIGGYSGITKMNVHRKAENGDNERLLNYDRGWDVVNQDPEIQQEIDRVIAIFG